MEYFGLIAKKMGEAVKAALRNDGYLVFDMTELKKQNTNLFQKTIINPVYYKLDRRV